MTDQPALSPVPVTRPFLPPLDEFVARLRVIWKTGVLTNQGPMVRELESTIQEQLGLPHPVLTVANGGLGLQIILKAMGIRGEVVTTPFSYIATTSCPLWEGCTVRFADIEPNFLTLDPAAVEAAITPRTEAILATHVYGIPCDHEGLSAVAQRHGLALIYDAAHAFGVTWQGRSVLEFGDASMVSLHATKLFHSVEGGFVVARDPKVSDRMEWMRRFGHDGTECFHGIGMNAKMSEVHAAMGLCVLVHLDTIRARRMALCAAYDSALEHLAPAVIPVPLRPGAGTNFAYYPVKFESESCLIASLEHLNAAGIFPRRYFYPSLDGVFSAPSGVTPIAKDAAARLLCLPLAVDYEPSLAARVSSIIGECLS